MDKYTIESGHALPVKRAKERYPTAALSVGESYLIPDKSKYASAGSAAYQYGKRSGKTFAVRMTDDGVRVFRIA